MDVVVNPKTFLKVSHIQEHPTSPPGTETSIDVASEGYDSIC